MNSDEPAITRELGVLHVHATLDRATTATRWRYPTEFQTWHPAARMGRACDWRAGAVGLGS